MSAESAADYALTFSQQRIRADMVSELSRQHLHELGVTPLGDVILLLKHAARCAQEESAAESAHKLPSTDIPDADTVTDTLHTATPEPPRTATPEPQPTDDHRIVSVKRALSPVLARSQDTTGTITSAAKSRPILSAAKPRPKLSAAKPAPATAADRSVFKRVVFESPSSDTSVSSTTTNSGGGDRALLRLRKKQSIDAADRETGSMRSVERYNEAVNESTRFSVTGLGVGGAAERQCLSSGEEQSVSGSEFLNNLLRRIVPTASHDQLQYQGVICSKRRRISDPTPSVVTTSFTPNKGTLVSDRIASGGRSERSVKHRLSTKEPAKSPSTLTQRSMTRSISDASGVRSRLGRREAVKTPSSVFSRLG